MVFRYHFSIQAVYKFNGLYEVYSRPLDHFVNDIEKSQKINFLKVKVLKIHFNMADYWLGSTVIKK